MNFKKSINIFKDIMLSLDVLVFIGIRTSDTMTRTCKIVVYVVETLRNNTYRGNPGSNPPMFLTRSRIHERIVSMRLLGIILRVLRLEVSAYNVYISNHFCSTGRGSKIR